MKYCCLDIGNVLCTTNFTPFLHTLSKDLNISLEEANYFLNRTQKLHDLGYTAMSDELRDHFKIRSQPLIDDLIQKWNQSITVDGKILRSFYHWMSNKDLKIALLSNIGPEHAVQIPVMFDRECTGFFEECIPYFSCEVGARKPSTIYYQSFLARYPKFRGCLYIDDLVENLEASEKFGFQTFRFELNKFNDFSKKTKEEIWNNIEELLKI